MVFASHHPTLEWAEENLEKVFAPAARVINLGPSQNSCGPYTVMIHE